MHLLVTASLFIAAPPLGEQKTIALDDAKTLPASELARRVLPPESGRKIAGGTLHRQFLPFVSYRAVFWEAVQPVAPMICRRKAHGVQLDNNSASWNDDPTGTLLKVGEADSGDTFALSYPAPATADSCARQTGYVAPRIEDQASTLAVLDDLMEAMSLARGVNTLPFELTCEAEDGDDSCSNARAALANLPLSELMSVDFEPTEYQTVSVTPTGEGQSVRVRQAMPGAATIPIAAFGRSGPDGKSWRVTLNGASRELREIGLRRTTVIYH